MTKWGIEYLKAVADQETLLFPEDLILVQDTGFEGDAPDDVIACQPKKKPRGKELSAKDKARNTLISRLRIAVEHVISGIKRCHIVKDLFRNTKPFFDDLVMEVACGLHNFRAGNCTLSTYEFVDVVDFRLRRNPLCPIFRKSAK